MIRNGYSSDSLDFSQPADEQFVATSHATTTQYVGFGSPQDVIQSRADHPYLVPSPIHWHPPALTSPHENTEQPVQGETQEYQENFTFDFEGYPEERLPVADMFKFDSDIPNFPNWKPNCNRDLDHGHQEKSIRLAGLVPDVPDATRLPYLVWRHNDGPDAIEFSRPRN